MKIKPEIRERIVVAASALAAEGIDSPTNEQVRERMGGGSLSHISPVMREWRESRKAEVVAALEMPAELRKAIESSVGQVWTAASKLASAQVETVRQEADAAIEAATGERDEALAEVSRLEERIAELQKAVTEKEQAVSQAREELERDRAQSSKLISDNAALVARVDDRDEQIKGLKAEWKESRDDNKALQNELVEIARDSGKGKR
ncbi:DNA-binding protein [Shewanella loihica]|uniref:KfrAs n=1 Tax=Shewanella loihica (strain ATCC BAA-1088 / PV-4) TaxID=323850 RepID=A3QBL7_SHELP|nr:DNA-binding protein [Shewanella loihica]ABO22865.1 KfrAs [Shewanella loihica PV-4]